MCNLIADCRVSCSGRPTIRPHWLLPAHWPTNVAWPPVLLWMAALITISCWLQQDYLMINHFVDHRGKSYKARRYTGRRHCSHSTQQTNRQATLHSAQTGLKLPPLTLLCLYIVGQKRQDTKLLPIAFPNINRSSKIFSLAVADSLVNLEQAHI